MEVRSRSTDKLTAQTRRLTDCLERACEKFGAQLECEVSTMYLGYMHTDETPFLQEVFAAERTIGLCPTTAVTGGGSDANVHNQHGIVALNIGVGMEKVHTTSEQLRIEDMYNCARLCLQLSLA